MSDDMDSIERGFDRMVSAHELVQQIVAEIQRIRLEPLPEPPEWLVEALKEQEND